METLTETHLRCLQVLGLKVCTHTQPLLILVRTLLVIVGRKKKTDCIGVNVLPCGTGDYLHTGEYSETLLSITCPEGLNNKLKHVLYFYKQKHFP